MTIAAEWREHGSRDEFVGSVAAEVEATISSAVAARGEALVALPGGSTPRAVFKRLAQARLLWSKTVIIPTDDRLVDDAHELSNFRLLAENFADAGARICSIATPDVDHHAAGELADARLQELRWPPDLVWLGMGDDGHTASIFVGPDLQGALHAADGRRAVGVIPDPLPPEAPVARVTLTRAAILAGRTILVTITRPEKKALLRQALAEGESSALPIGQVLAGSRTPIRIHYCAD